MALLPGAGVAFGCPPGDRRGVPSLCVSWPRPGLSESTQQVSTQLGGGLEAKVRRRRHACHLECGLTRKPVVSKVQVEPPRGSRVCGPPAAAALTSLRCPGDVWAGAPALAGPLGSVGPQQQHGERARPHHRPALPREGTLLVPVGGDGHGGAAPGADGGLGPALEKAGVGPCVLPNPRSRGRGQAPCVWAFRGLRPPAAGRGGKA